MKYLILLLGTAFSITGMAQVKVGDNPTAVNPSSVFEAESTNKGFLPPRMTTAQRNAIATPAEGLMVYNTTTKRINYYTGASWYQMSGENTVPVGTLKRADGSNIIFMSHNLGADYLQDPLVPSQAIMGNYYQWGRINPVATAYTPPGPVAGWNTGTVPDNAWGAVKTVNDPCPAEFRVPTKTDWEQIFGSGSGNTFTMVGTWVIGSTNFGAGIYISNSGSVRLFLPAAAYRDRFTGALAENDDTSYYWTSTAKPTGQAYTLFMQNSGPGIHYFPKNEGMLVRCVKE